jgi:hypothetical protein
MKNFNMSGMFCQILKHICERVSWKTVWEHAIFLLLRIRSLKFCIVASSESAMAISGRWKGEAYAT